MLIKKILFLVHCENSFRSNFPANFIKNIIANIKRNNYSEVIHFTSNIDSFAPIEELKPFITQEIDWAWGYEPEMFANKNDELQWVIDADHKSLHPYTWIPPYLRNYKGARITLGGGCEGECLADMEVILDHLELKYKKVKSMCF